MVGYGDDEYTTTVLELTYNYGVTEYTKGTGYGQVSKSVLVSCVIFSRIAAYFLTRIILLKDIDLKCTALASDFPCMSYCLQLNFKPSLILEVSSHVGH